MESKYDKFLMSYVVAKRAKEILEEDIHYFPKNQRPKNEINEAIKEIEEDLLDVDIRHDSFEQVKEEEDTLDVLYSSIKKQNNDTVVDEDIEELSDLDIEEDDDDEEDDLEDDELEEDDDDILDDDLEDLEEDDDENEEDDIDEEAIKEDI
jgi:DNA-directed RNA polymerase subunit K/omega